MAEDLIRYDVLVQEAMRSVVRKVLTETARAGLPGNHHFFIAFDTRASGVRISSRLRERYPEEMTVVLQHQFWNLIVSDTGFEVGLSFGGTPERLLVPYTAIKGFFDPSVDFGLQFEVVNDDEEAGAGAAPNAEGEGEAAPAPTALPTPPGAAAPAAEAADGAAEVEEAPAKQAEVVSLDAFRKKP
jgi:hypothetical protein